MSYIEVEDFLNAGPTMDGERFFNAKLGHGGKTWITEAAIIKRVDFAQGATWLFWMDRATEQVRIFLNGSVEEINGKLMLFAEYEYAPGEWN